ncbi:hypothetical protein BH11ACT6_BH11ACT6_35420 [soil metagenome]
MAVTLTPAEADTKISQIHDARDQAVIKLNQISDIQEKMLASAWHGSSADTYRATAQNQRDEFDQVINELNSVVNTGSEHMRAIANADQG